MDRKWRTNRAAIDTVLSFPAFSDLVPSAPPPTNGQPLTTLTDLYAVYTVLHIERKQWEIRWSEEAQLYYFIVRWEVSQESLQIAAAPEGDEDMPQPIPEEAAAQAAAAENPNGNPEIQRNKNDEQQGEGTQNKEGATTTTSDQDKNKLTMRTQILVPLTSAYQNLTPALLQKFFAIRNVIAQQMILGLVDSNGVVTRCCLYNYIQAPLEGPGTANLELLDD